MVISIFKQFFLLGWVCFGGPAAHIGYFRRRFVDELQWVDEDRFGHTLALCQFLPGPASSQLGFGIGYQKAGIVGAIAAFIGFTLPSFFIMYGLALLLKVDAWTSSEWVVTLISGLKLLAVVVVADAVLSMAKSFCNSLIHKAIAIGATAALVLMPSVAVQVGLLLTAAGIGYWQHSGVKLEQNISICFMPLILFLVVLLALVMLPSSVNGELLKQFYLSGTLVFGGGHVVLPLLQNGLSSYIDPQTFLSGYGFAQMVPGPMFTLSSFLGASIWQGSALAGAVLATLFIFAPGFLLMLSVINGWFTLANNQKIKGIVGAVNACVVGVLSAAWFNPVVTSAVNSISEIIIVTLGFLLLRLAKLNVFIVGIILIALSLVIAQR
ncbi:chromate efflux transporter [Parashewanella curva]|uniref:Chromate efflux transporter n=1 Tax=Parashewanella curva TaxID=2338552 RepID=A0A3L8Q0Q8_9GAMM|nr:chromate efflux transporter [Parashewanella curva]RLV59972.1 chromate efflux transporter [Parashewanella curva]